MFLFFSIWVQFTQHYKNIRNPVDYQRGIKITRSLDSAYYKSDVVSFKALPIFSHSLFHRKSLLLEQIDETICESRSFAESMIHTLSAKYACCSPRVSE
jgi:hypothetical protein